MLTDELEFSISQYIDGTLADESQRAAVEEALATNSDARIAYAGYQRMNELLVTAAPPLPEVNWDAVHTQISSSIDRADEADEESRRSRMNIGTWMRWTGAAVAVAAALLIVVSVQLKHPAESAGSAHPKIEISGPHAESVAVIGSMDVSFGPGSSEAIPVANGNMSNVQIGSSGVAIGPSPEVASSATMLLDDELGDRQGRVVIVGDTSTPPPADSIGSPF